MSRCCLIAVIFLLITTFVNRTLLAITIDDFSAGSFSIEVLRYETESATQIGLPTTNTLGGSRFVTLNGLGPTPQSSVRVSVDSAFTEFRYDADPGSTAANFRIVYGSATNLQANLLADGTNSIVFDFAFADFESGVGYFDISVTTQPGGRYLYVPVVNSASPFSLVLPYRAFETGYPGANFADVSKLTIGTGNGNLRGEFAFSGIRTAYYADGDFNFDGQVNTQDYFLWRNHFGRSNAGYPIDPADGNRDGKVDAADYLLWRRFATTSSSTPNSVPEPAAAVMLTIGLLTLTCIGFRRERISSVVS